MAKKKSDNTLLWLLGIGAAWLIFSKKEQPTYNDPTPQIPTTLPAVSKIRYK